LDDRKIRVEEPILTDGFFVKPQISDSPQNDSRALVKMRVSKSYQIYIFSYPPGLNHCSGVIGISVIEQFGYAAVCQKRKSHSDWIEEPDNRQVMNGGKNPFRTGLKGFFAKP
jgi:hypothetical protein